METPHGKIFVREWPAQGAQRGTALLIHGLFSDSQSFGTLARKLSAKGLRVLAADLPGHGETQSGATAIADIVSAIRAVLPAAPTHLVGHSFGAIIATHLADRAASLTLLSPAGTGEEINGAFVAAMLAGHIERALPLLGEKLPPEATAALAGHLARNATQLAAMSSAIAAGGSQTVSILATLRTLTIPLSAVYLRDDAIIPAAHALNLPPNAAVRFLPGASHLPHWREPDFIASLIS